MGRRGYHNRSANPHPPSPGAWSPLSRVRERSFKVTSCRPSPALRLQGGEGGAQPQGWEGEVGGATEERGKGARRQSHASAANLRTAGRYTFPGQPCALRERVASVARRVTVLPRSKFSLGIVRAARWWSLPSCGRLCDGKICSSSPALNCGRASGEPGQSTTPWRPAFAGMTIMPGLRTRISETGC